MNRAKSFRLSDAMNLINVHPIEKCEGQACCIHNPSEHHMLTWPQLWRQDRQLMERICEHGVGHPDPDHMSYFRSRYGDEVAWGEGVHGCCGCCIAGEYDDVQ